MRIALVGGFNPYSLEMSYSRAFELLHHEVLPFDFEARYASNFWAASRLTEMLSRPVLSRAVSNDLVSWVEHARPDLVIVFKGRFLSPKSLRSIKRLRSDLPLLNFNPDSPWEPANSTSEILGALPIYDIHFTWSRLLLERFKASGAKHVEYLPFAYDPALHQPLRDADRKKDKEFDAIFIGTYDRVRDEQLSELSNFKIGIWGNDWERSRLVPKSWLKGKAVYGNASVELMERSAVQLNLLRNQNVASHNMRSFEIPATANLMLTDRTPEHLEFFEEGREIECFSGVGELQEKLRMLNSATNPVNYGQNAYVRVLDETYEKRARDILSAL